ncbi:MAG: hypothetical protein ACFCUG_05450 [Thiotrichales bacterium]
MKTLLLPLLLSATLAGPAHADEIVDTINSALKAYKDGDFVVAKEDLDYASQLLAKQKATGLSRLLPKELAGWARKDGDTQALGAGMFGGGTMASAEYSKGEKNLNIQLMADNPMMAAVAGMFNNPSLMGAAGTQKRINRQKVMIDSDGEMTSMIGKVLVQISGDASIEDKEAYFNALDIKALEGF